VSGIWCEQQRHRTDIAGKEKDREEQDERRFQKTVGAKARQEGSIAPDADSILLVLFRYQAHLKVL
jgi:hypothetical protein